jgi:predicted ATPase
VGRADELDVLERVLDELDRGLPGAIELVGEPGIGKTRLLSELAARAELHGHLVLLGSASELERELPFSVFVDALDEYVESLDPNVLCSLDDDVQAELAHVFPSLAALAGGRAVALQHERYRSHRAVRALLEQLAQTRPLVLVLDDFHWARSGVGGAARRAAAPAARCGGTHRSGTPTLPHAGRLTAALERAHRAAALTASSSARSRRVEARELLGQRSTPPARRLYEESGGNPFYLEQLARSLDRAGGATSPPRSH